MSDVIPNEVLKAIAEKHSLGGEWNLVPEQGRIHQTFFVGNAVVKIPHDEPDCVCDTYTESVAAPAAHRAEIRTPKVIAFDDSKLELPVPFLIFERFFGSPCRERLGPEMAVKVGREIGRVQATVTDCPDPDNWLDEVPGEDLETEWQLYSMTKEFFMEAPKRPVVFDVILKSPLETDKVFTHNDVHHKNILIGSTGEICLIDWGDAGWGKPSCDFGVLDPLDLEDSLTGYAEWMPVTPELRAGIMREQFGHVFRHFNEGLASGAFTEGSKASRAVMRATKLLKFDCLGFMKGHNS